MIVTAHNPETTDLEKTYLSAFLAKGSNSLAVKNNDRFVNGRRILLGAMGAENAEMLTLSSVNANKIALGTSGNTIFDHNSDESVYALEFDKIRFYRATSLNGTYNLLTTVDIDVDNADKVTRYDDTTSLPTHFYKISFYDSIADEESDLSDAIPATGFALTTAGNLIDQVVRRVRDTGFTVLSFQEYIDVMNEVGDDLLTQAQKPYVFLKKSVALNTTLNQNYIDVLATVTDFWKFDYVEVSTYQAGQRRFQEITPLSLEQWNNRYKYTPQLTRNDVTDIAFDDETKRLYISPTPKTSETGVVILHYYKKFTPIVSSGDVVETPIPLIYRYKLMAEYYSSKSELDRQWERLAEKYETKYGNEIVKMQRVNRLDVGTPRSFRPPRTYRRRMYTLRGGAR